VTTAPIVPPPRVVELAAGRPLRLVWQNELGGLTFAAGDDRHVKWAPRGSGVDLAAERARLEWALAFVRVPRVIAAGSDADGAWLVTVTLPGESAVAERWTRRPAAAVAAIGAGLRAFHDALPVAICPFDASLAARLGDIRRRAAARRLDRARWHPDHRPLSIARALAYLEVAPPVDRLVVCHGDSCAPNTLIGDDGRATGHVDLGRLGVADRWADLAIATWSTRWNYGEGWEAALLDAYGVDPDEARTRYYRLLWDLGP
jgi:kanamycin kinase